jgi:hypothetical protein
LQSAFQLARRRRAAPLRLTLVSIIARICDTRKWGRLARNDLSNKCTNQRRLVLWIGRFSVADVFDTNKYHKARSRVPDGMLPLKICQSSGEIEYRSGVAENQFPGRPAARHGGTGDMWVPLPKTWRAITRWSFPTRAAWSSLASRRAVRQENASRRRCRHSRCAQDRASPLIAR